MKRELNVVSLSGGKDSTAMLLKMLETGIRIDIILFCDTGLEFAEMYRHLDKLEKNIGIPIIRLYPEYSFEHYLLCHKIRRKDCDKFKERYGENVQGFSWASPNMRWCTSMLKAKPREKFLQPLRKEYIVTEYVGIAADEQYRLKRKQNQRKNVVFPLVEWGMTEEDCLNYCYEQGYDWDGLYTQFKRVSCWCCPLQSLSSLRVLRKNYPHLWERLKQWDSETWRNFRKDYSAAELEQRFLFEEKCIEEGKPITGKEFFTELRKLREDNRI